MGKVAPLGEGSVNRNFADFAYRLIRCCYVSGNPGEFSLDSSNERLDFLDPGSFDCQSSIQIFYPQPSFIGFRSQVRDIGKVDG